MATAKTAPKIAPKRTDLKITSVNGINNTKKEMLKLFDKLPLANQEEVLNELGCGTKFFTCHCCGKLRRRGDFYFSSEANSATGVTKICKECAYAIAVPSVDGIEQMPTKLTVDDALYALNKPFLDSLWESSLLEAANNASGKLKNNVWTSYIKNVQMQQYYTLTYRESDNYTGGMFSMEDLERDALPKDQEILKQFEKNKNDTLRLLGYLPFEKEKLTDQPFLYSQLIGFLDASEEGNDDMMRTSSIIDIVRSFLQQSNINDMIADLTRDPRNAEKNVATVKALQEMKKNITMNVTKLAEQSCISLKNSKSNTKGTNTWTGKLSMIKDLNLREGEVNGFDMETCRGMQQVMDLSNASIMKQLALDESEWSDMVAEQRDKIVKLQSELDQFKEISRILLRENIDLKDFMKEKNVPIEINLIDLDELYSPFSSIEEIDEKTIENVDNGSVEISEEEGDSIA